MNAKLKSQIKTYAGVAGALLAVNKASGQIVYVDVNPDTLVDASPLNSGIHNYYLDMDTDGTMDFDFQVKWDSNSSTQFQFVKIVALNSNKVMNDLYPFPTSHSSSFFTVPVKLNTGDTIKYLSSSSYPFWRGGPNQRLIWDNTGYTYGVWNDFNNDYFLPIALNKNSYYEYGWIRLRTLAFHSFIIRDYAYNTIPNTPILAGDTINASLGINQISNTVFISQYHNNILINSATQLQNAAIKIYDLLGKEILIKTFSGNEASVTIDKKGIYVVEVMSDKGISRKKVFIY